MTSYTYGYVRVSRQDQNESLQTDALEKAGVDRIFIDKASGTLEHRPQMDTMLSLLRPGDVVVCWRLDRMSRSLRHLIDQVAWFDEHEVGLRSLQESIDTTTAGGRLVVHVFGALAEFEKGLLVERTMAGLAAARARGRRGGRPAALTRDQVKTAQALYDQRDMIVAEIGQVLGVSRAAIYRALGRKN
jgi:DNA invertase Pin-like site-specific DNA recombinase